MPKIAVLLADGFEEIEAITIIDILRRGNLDVVTAGLKPGNITGAHAIPVTPDTGIDSIRADDFDMIILPGGGPGTKTLKADPRVAELVRQFYNLGKLTGAICAAPTVLYAAGILHQKRVTSFPGTDAEMPDVSYSTDTVVWDGILVTSRAAGTAGAFALSIVAKLAGQAAADKLKSAMLY
ncbi:MAG: hypothetical protein A2014_08570 [Spirochaetes bacterium GWF1_49_6]|nr:MAG: hypothetical protein A2014_08570 [Spirochaetes bacterium GWF1_49_6]